MNILRIAADLIRTASIRQIIIAFAIVFVLIGLSSYQAKAESHACNTLERATVNIFDRYGESPVGQGLAGDHMARLFVNEQSGTWTVLMISAEGRACLSLFGDAWGPVPTAPSGTKG
jgi:hypothetical protein